MSETVAIEANGIGKDYGDHRVLERISLTITEGSFCTIVGASGCGKSTFLRLLLSQELPTRGHLYLYGKELPKEPTPDRGIVFQRYSVFTHLTVEENLILSAEFKASPFWGRYFGKDRKSALGEIDDLLDKIGLIGARKRYPSQLSGGMQQRLAIAQALLMRPRVLLLDEPFGALDPGIRAEMHDLMLGLWEENNMTVFMVTHDIHEAFKLGTRLLVFDKDHDNPNRPEGYGATITYDIPLKAGTPEIRPEDIFNVRTREEIAGAQIK